MKHTVQPAGTPAFSAQPASRPALPPVDWPRPWYDAVRTAAAQAGLAGDAGIAAGAGTNARTCPTVSAGAGIGTEAATGTVAGTDTPTHVETGLFTTVFTARARALGLVNHAGLPVSFVPQAALPEDTAYEEHIGATGCVPTRDNLHDFFNGLVWLSFPLVKRALNALQAAQIARDGVRGQRGPARDAATIFDENAALLVIADDGAGHVLADALRSHRWRDAFVDRAAMFGPPGSSAPAQVWLFGHALMEKLMAPYKAITAHTVVVAAPPAYFAQPADGQQAWIDAHLAQVLRTEGLGKAAFTPLPVLGIPGWWHGQDDAFYDDATVFRPKRPPAGHVTGARGIAVASRPSTQEQT